MGKTYRKDKPESKQRSDSHPGNHGDKSINHDHDRTAKKRMLKDIEHHWNDRDVDDYE